MYVCGVSLHECQRSIATPYLCFMRNARVRVSERLDPTKQLTRILPCAWHWQTRSDWVNNSTMFTASTVSIQSVVSSRRLRIFWPGVSCQTNSPRLLCCFFLLIPTLSASSLYSICSPPRSGLTLPEPVRMLPRLAPPAQLRRWLMPSSVRSSVFSAAPLLPTRRLG